MNIPNVNKILLLVTIVLVLAMGGLLYWQMSSHDDNYYAVLTVSGDLFFGKLSFSGLYLTDVWAIQRNPQDTQNPVSLVKFDKSFFGPEDKLYLNPKNILWKTKLRSDSQVLAQIKAMPGLQQQQSPLFQQPPSQSQNQQLPPQSPSKK